MYGNNSNNYYGVDTQSLSVKLSAVMKRVYVKMTLALIVSALVAMFCAESPAYLNLLAQHTWIMWVCFFGELGLVIAINGAIRTLSSAAATALFFLFSAVNGFTLAPIFLVYTGDAISTTFFVTAGTFAAMSVYGYCTSADLTRMGSLLFMTLIGVIIASFVNFFLHSETMMWIITYAGVIIFVGLTAYDTQQIKRMAVQVDDASVGKLATIGALNLYLDFVNLFLYLLRIFGNRN